VANVLVGKLSPDEGGRPYLIHSEHLEKTNHLTIAKLFNDSLSILWPNGIKHDKVLLLVSDGAAYMIKAAKALKILFVRLVHITCLAHALHLVCEVVRFQYPVVNSFVSTVKKIFKKSPKRMQMFKELCPKLPLPPSPICTRWGTWLRAVEYYAEHLHDMQRVIEALEEDAESVKEAKRLLKNPELTHGIAVIRQNYTFIPNFIAKLERAKSPVSENLTILKEVVDKLTSVPDEPVKAKMRSVLAKNQGLKAMSDVVSLNMEKIGKYEEFADMSPLELASFKYAPLVSCDIERSFSLYNVLLSQNRRSFIFENIRMHLIICYNN